MREDHRRSRDVKKDEKKCTFAITGPVYRRRVDRSRVEKIRRGPFLLTVSRFIAVHRAQLSTAISPLESNDGMRVRVIARFHCRLYDLPAVLGETNIGREQR